jgi:hypothetical protein
MGVEMKAPSRYLTERRMSRVNAAVGLVFARVGAGWAGSISRKVQISANDGDYTGVPCVKDGICRR